MHGIGQVCVCVCASTGGGHCSTRRPGAASIPRSIHLQVPLSSVGSSGPI